MHPSYLQSFACDYFESQIALFIKEISVKIKEYIPVNATKVSLSKRHLSEILWYYPGIIVGTDYRFNGFNICSQQLVSFSARFLDGMKEKGYNVEFLYNVDSDVRSELITATLIRIYLGNDHGPSYLDFELVKQDESIFISETS